MKRLIIIQILILILGLISKLAWSQGNGTSTPSKLKIVIPVREFSDFVAINRNFVTGENNYSGFAIEVFNAVMKSLPSPIPFEFVPFQNPDGTMKGSFDDMLEAVFNKEYDGAVGEISILFSRTRWVDFTMPYMDTSITMLVPIKQQSTTKDDGYSLIGITYAFLITTFVLGFIVFVVGAISTWSRCSGGKDDVWRDKALRSQIQTRLLITIFFLILFTLVSCYVISQTSANTISQPRSGTTKNLNQLIRKGSNVGYREKSFIYDLLIYKGFTSSKLISLKSEEEMVDMLSKGTSNGGVDAIVADAPQIKLLQAKYCDKFTMVPTINLHATGFGFAFGKGADIVEDVSNGILRLVDKGELGKIQDRTIGSLEACPSDPNGGLDGAPSFLPPDYKWILIVGSLLVGLLVIVYSVFLF